MAAVKVLAGEFDIEVSTTPLVTPTWVHIGGVRSITISPSKGTADIRDFDSNQWLEHLVVNRGASWSIEAQRLEDPADGTRDAGQAGVEAYQWLVGAGALAPFRVTSPGGNLFTFEGSVNVTPIGGGTDDPATWSAEIEMSGALVLA